MAAAWCGDRDRDDLPPAGSWDAARRGSPAWQPPVAGGALGLVHELGLHIVNLVGTLVATELTLRSLLPKPWLLASLPHGFLAPLPCLPCLPLPYTCPSSLLPTLMGVSLDPNPEDSASVQHRNGAIQDKATHYSRTSVSSSRKWGHGDRRATILTSWGSDGDQLRAWV